MCLRTCSSKSTSDLGACEWSTAGGEQMRVPKVTVNWVRSDCMLIANHWEVHNQPSDKKNIARKGSCIGI